VTGAGGHHVRKWVGAPVRRVRGRSRGQGVVEYGLILSLSALLAIGLLVFAGGTVADVLDLIVDAVDAAEGR
jgi:Flp pilus assembly pilin Flp